MSTPQASATSSLSTSSQASSSSSSRQNRRSTRSSSSHEELNQTSIHLPPNVTSSEYYFEGDVPNVLADRVLALHSHAHSTTDKNELNGDRSGTNWIGSLLRRDSDKSVRKSDEQGGSKYFGQEESEVLLGDQNEGTDSEQDEDEHALDEGDHAASGNGTRTFRRSSRSKSKSLHRKLPWYKRPSPWFFFPGTLVMALSIGMTISPKLEIYYQLVCRAIEPEKSGVTLPPPMVDVWKRPLGAVSPISSKGPNDDDDVTAFVTKATDAQAQASAQSDSSLVAIAGDSWAKQCHKSPEVQKGVASLAMLLSLIMGVLSALTTGFYGSLSDRKGRKPILVLAMCGSIMMDAIVLFTVKYHHVVGYRFLLVGPLVDGLLGGMTTAQATSNAYLADCTDAGSRARIFSILGGIMFAGIAVGPSIGSILVRESGSILLPFYVALAMHIIYASVMLVLFPESLSQTRQYAARKRYAEEKQARIASEQAEVQQAKAEGLPMVILLRLKRTVLRPWRFLKPLGLLVPRKRDPNEKELDRPLMDALGPVQAGWDFSLVKIAVGMACFSTCMAVYQVKLLYTSYRFGWGPEENGLYLSFIGVSRVVSLIIVLPLFVRYFRKPAPLPRRPRPERELDSAGPMELSPEQQEWDKEARWLRTVHDSHFDLLLARLSLGVDMIGYTFMALNGGSVTKFVTATVLSSFGSGVSAAVQSLALAHASPRDSGRLFASLSVLGSVAGQIVGPLLFGAVFIGTVENLPETIFWLLVGLLGCSLIALLTVRLRPKVKGLEDVQDQEARSDRTDIANRGRSTTRRREPTNGSAIEL